jgi:hypothetical protein
VGPYPLPQAPTPNPLSPVGRESEAHPAIGIIPSPDPEGVLVPKLGLGTPALAKLSLASFFVPKCNLGTS